MRIYRLFMVKARRTDSKEVTVTGIQTIEHLNKVIKKVKQLPLVIPESVYYEEYKAGFSFGKLPKVCTVIETKEEIARKLDFMQTF